MEPQFSLKRHNSASHSHPPPPQPPPPPNSNAASTTAETQFRILCPASKAGGIIGKFGAVIRQLREDTRARIRILRDSAAFSGERIILISSDSKNPNPNESEDYGGGTVAQLALMKVFERLMKVDEERNNEEKADDGNGSTVCRLLAPNNQVGCVLGRGGKIVEKIRQESGAQVRVLPKEQLPACASPGDELIQMTGNIQAVKKALWSVSSCLQEHPRADVFPGANNSSHNDSFPHKGAHAADHHSRGFMTGPASENFGHNHRMIPEEDVVFRLLCPIDKTGSLIGKGGSVVRAIQNETGASIKIGDLIASDSDERVVVVSARESMDLKRSPAQDAAIRVLSKVAEIGFEPGAAVTARLLVHSQQIGCLLGKGGLIITEMRRLTGASIRIIGRDQGVKLSTGKDELVQVVGNLPTVQDALFQITCRLRETFFSPKQHHSHVGSSPYFTSYQELPSPSFRPRHDQASPGDYHSPVGLSHAYETHNAGQGIAHPSFSHDADRTDGANGEHDHYHYGGERTYGLSFERPSSPKVWHSQAVDYGNISGFSDAANSSESGPMPMVTSVEVVIPQTLLPHVYGENRSNLAHITQFSGADINIHDPNPGATEGRVVLSGTPNQLHAAQSLVQAFILCGQAF